MKKHLAMVLIPSLAFADCNWKADIQPTLKHTFEYSEGCHLAVGEMKQSLSITNQKVSLLDDSLKATNLALDMADKRAENWMKTADDLEGDLQKVERSQEKNAWLCFGAGVLTVLVVGIAMHSTVR